MIQKPVLDLEALLAPIPGERPTGVSLRGEDDGGSPPADVTLFYELRSAYNQARSAERKAEEAASLPKDDPAAQVDPPDWDAVKQPALAILATQSKDLWVAARLIEAAFRTDGFPGLRDGFRLARRLCEEYWDDLYPRRSPSTGYEERVADFGQIFSNEKLLQLPIVLQGSLTGRPGRTAYVYQKACDLERLKTTDPEAYEAQKSEGAVTLADFAQDVQEDGPEFYRELAEAIQECIEELDSLIAAFEERLAADDGYPVTMSSAGPVREALHTCVQALRGIAPQALDEAAARDDATPAVPAAADEQPGGGAARPAAVAAPGAIATREQAFQALEAVAKFFEKNEPQSFIPYSLRQLIRRGNLSLPELLAELIASEEARRDFARLTGVPEPQENRD